MADLVLTQLIGIWMRRLAAQALASCRAQLSECERTNLDQPAPGSFTLPRRQSEIFSRHYEFLADVVIIVVVVVVIFVHHVRFSSFN
jgi:hypothetical protein